MTLPEKADARLWLPVNSIDIMKPVFSPDINIIAHEFTHYSSIALTGLVPVRLKQFNLMEHRCLDIQTRSNDDSDHVNTHSTSEREREITTKCIYYAII